MQSFKELCENLLQQVQFLQDNKERPMDELTNLGTQIGDDELQEIVKEKD